MSDPDWRAALVSDQTITVWPMAADASAGASEVLPRDALNRLPGPVIAAGLDVKPRPVPARPVLVTTHVPDAPQVAAIPMLRQETPAALSRGAETAIAGYLSAHPTYDGVLVILGAETCWAHISAEEVVSFQCFLTPVLMTALAAPTPVPNAEFHKALDATLSRPEKLAQQLASTRAAGTDQAAAHLIGAEIAAAKPYWLGQAVTVLANADDAAPYLRALEKQGVGAAQADLTSAYLAGFRLAWAQLSA